MKVDIFTDGSALGNPGPGGYGVILQSGRYYKELSAGYRMTTNNRMELLAVIVGLEALKKPGTQVCVYSDSTYVVRAVEEGWLDNWQSKDFRKKKNVDLWKRYLDVASRHKIRFIWVKGHAGHPQNEKCDRLAVTAASAPVEALLEDDGFIAVTP
ncbi:MAG: ribonuclease HI [Bacteroidales bacterium]|jgi:ribonuclease HI|nr:ribonuclease HI [Bacteroidales bacterium]MDD2264063.1 ribonuclease HI [Bacteroidales bacterium]MDD2831297.1 ribonuclease HI [Bacteroidales bacterium]MDD3208590.1 ribonuclease HI [Bacteroidales bacterium]MDD3697153.1 ribonuclease HI [Bacteroidales bacterium]